MSVWPEPIAERDGRPVNKLGEASDCSKTACVIVSLDEDEEEEAREVGEASNEDADDDEVERGSRGELRSLRLRLECPLE